MTFDQGVCGAAAKSRKVQRVEDVHAFSGHIACDSASNSEIVVPLIRDGELIGVLDIDSPKRARSPRRMKPECELGEILSRGSLAQLLQPLVAERARDQHHRAGQRPASLPQKFATSGPGLPLGAAPSTSAATSVAFADIIAHRLHRLALPDDDFASIPDSSRISPIAALTTPSMRSRCSSSIAAWTPPN